MSPFYSPISEIILSLFKKLIQVPRCISEELIILTGGKGAFLHIVSFKCSILNVYNFQLIIQEFPNNINLKLEGIEGEGFKEITKSVQHVLTKGSSRNCLAALLSIFTLTSLRHERGYNLKHSGLGDATVVE